MALPSALVVLSSSVYSPSQSGSLKAYMPAESVVAFPPMATPCLL